MFYKSRTVSFETDPTKTFTELCPDELPVVGGQDIVPALNEQAKYADWRMASKEEHGDNSLWLATKEKIQGTPITGHLHMDQHWNGHSKIGSYGAQLLDGLPALWEYRFVAYKGMEPDMHPYGALYHTMDWRKYRMSTGVLEVCAFEKIDTVILGGLAFDKCVKETGIQFLDAGFNVIVNLEATRAIFPENIPAVCEELRQAGAIIIFSTKELDDLITDDTANSTLKKDQSNEHDNMFNVLFKTGD